MNIKKVKWLVCCMQNICTECRSMLQMFVDNITFSCETEYFIISSENKDSTNTIGVVFFRHVIILGDINTTHKRLDHCDPSTVVCPSPLNSLGAAASLQWPSPTTAMEMWVELPQVSVEACRLCVWFKRKVAVKSCQVLSSPVKSCQVLSSPVKSCQECRCRAAFPVGTCWGGGLLKDATEQAPSVWPSERKPAPQFRDRQNYTSCFPSTEKIKWIPGLVAVNSACWFQGSTVEASCNKIL